MTTGSDGFDVHEDELFGPIGPTPDLSPALWEPLDCTRCGRPITWNDRWFIEGDPGKDGPAYHERCLAP